MPILRLKEIRDMSPSDRTKRLGDLRTELLRLRTMIRAGGTVENPARVRELRRTIARILTIESEQKLEAGKTRSERKRGK
jgi:large subunit ribosomal protein L29